MFQKIYFKLFLISLVSFASFYESPSLQASYFLSFSRGAFRGAFRNSSKAFRNEAFRAGAVRAFSTGESLPQDRKELLRQNPFFKQIWFDELNAKKKESLRLKEQISKNAIPKRKLEKAKHHLSHIEENLITLEKNEKYILDGASFFYDYLKD